MGKETKDKKKDKKKEKKSDKKRPREKEEKLAKPQAVTVNDDEEQEVVRKLDVNSVKDKKRPREESKDEKLENEEEEDRSEEAGEAGKTPLPCPWFYKGIDHVTCQEGKCKKPHVMPDPDDADLTRRLDFRLATWAKKACFQNLRKKCTLGDACLFAHRDYTEDELVAMNVKQMEAKARAKEKKKAYREAKHQEHREKMAKTKLTPEERKQRKKEKRKAKKAAMTPEEYQAYKKQKKAQKKARKRRKLEEEKKKEAETPIDPALKKTKACVLFNQGKCHKTNLSCLFEHRPMTEEEAKEAAMKHRKSLRRQAKKRELKKARRKEKEGTTPA